MDKIDVTGKKVTPYDPGPGNDALHALKNQYGQKELVADGPSFKDYELACRSTV